MTMPDAYWQDERDSEQVRHVRMVPILPSRDACEYCGCGLSYGVCWWCQ